MPISVIDPIGYAFNRTGRMLFKPFDAAKWFTLGFCAWLAHLLEGGVNFNGGGNWNSGGPGGGQQDFKQAVDEAVAWVQANLDLVLLVGAAILILVIGFTLVLTWLSSRGQFMFVDGVVRNRGAVVEPWHRLRPPASSLFWFRVVLAIAGLIIFGGTVAGGVALAWQDIVAWQFGPGLIAGIAVSVLLSLVFGVTIALINLFLVDFVVPVMYLRGVRVMEAWGIFRRELLAGNVGPIALYVLMKIALAMSIGMASCLACCLTCCLAALPYIGMVILLPLFVFHRCYSLYFLEQVGDAWVVFADDRLPPVGAEGAAAGEPEHTL